MTDHPLPTPANTRRRKPDTRAEVAMEALALQMKLFIGGLHNLVLSPVTIGAAALDILFDTGGEYFYRVLGWGKEADEVIGLYAALERNEERIVEAGEEVAGETTP